MATRRPAPASERSGVTNGLTTGSPSNNCLARAVQVQVERRSMRVKSNNRETCLQACARPLKLTVRLHCISPLLLHRKASAGVVLGTMYTRRRVAAGKRH